MFTVYWEFREPTQTEARADTDAEWPAVPDEDSDGLGNHKAQTTGARYQGREKGMGFPLYVWKFCIMFNWTESWILNLNVFSLDGFEILRN